MLDRVVASDSPSIIRANENRIKDLEVQKMEMKEKVAFCGKPLRHYDEIFRTAMEFLAKPQKLWLSERLEDKRAVLKLTFQTVWPMFEMRDFEPQKPPYHSVC